MIQGHLYKVRIARHEIRIVVPDKSGEKLIDFARLALHEEFESEPYVYGKDDALEGSLQSIENLGKVYIDAKVVADS